MSDSHTPQLPDRQARLERVLADYLHSVESGRPLDREALVAANSDLSDELQAFFRNRESMDRLAEPLKAAAEAPTITGMLDPEAVPAGTTVRYFGDYELLDEIARGGMGVVFKARQVNLNRVVALKMILAGQLANDADVKRFYAEAEAAAKLDHPGIVPIFEIGQHDGQHYFSMAFVEGESLAKKVANGPLPPREAAELVKQVAGAVEYAHQKGIIHRDLKPANVLLDQTGHPRVTDFGLAKQMQADSGLTGTGQILGTPSYMPPEQAAGKTDQIGPRSDVYALGAILYCLLTGRPPFQAANPMDTLLQVLDQEPVSVRLLNAQVPLDLETIALKCLEKDPLRRYATARQLTDELARYLDGRPILARPVGSVERAIRWCRRNRAIAGLISAVAASLVAGTIISLHFAIQSGNRANEKAALADEKGRLAEEKGKLAEEMSALATRNQALFESERDAKEKEGRAKDEERLAKQQAEERRQQADDNARLARRHLYVANMNLAQAAWEDTKAGVVQELIDRHRPQDGDEDFRGFEWYYWNRLCHRDLLTLSGHTSPVRAVAFSPDGTRIASGAGFPQGDNTVKLWDAITGREIMTLTGHASPIWSIAFSPDGSRIAAAAYAGWIIVWDTATGRKTLTLNGRMGEFAGVAFSPDGTRIASGTGDVKIWEAASGRELQTLKGHTAEVICVAYSPDGTRIASGSTEQTVKLWDPATGAELRTLKGHTSLVRAIAFGPDGSRIASASRDQTIRIWDTETSEEIRQLRGHTNGVEGVAFSPDGTLIASGSIDQTVKLWDVATGEERSTLRGHAGPVAGVAFNAAGTRIVSAGGDAKLKVWDSATGPETLTLKRGSPAVALSPDGRHIVSQSYDGTPGVLSAKLWDSATGREIRTLQGHVSGVMGFAFSPDGTRIASASSNGSVKSWDVATGELLRDLQKTWDWVGTIAFSPDGARIATAAGVAFGERQDETIKVWDIPTGRNLLTLKGHSGAVAKLAFSADGTRLASAGHDRTIRVWNPVTGQETMKLQGHSLAVASVTFNSDGTRLASGSADNTIKFWDLTTGQAIRTLKGHSLIVTCVAFSPDGERIASASADNSVKLWEVATGQETLSLKGHAGRITVIEFNSDGTRIISSGDTVRLWDAPRQPFPAETTNTEGE